METVPMSMSCPPAVADVPVVPHKAVAEVSNIANYRRGLVVVSHGWQSKSTGGSKSGWRHRSVVVLVVVIVVAL